MKFYTKEQLICQYFVCPPWTRQLIHPTSHGCSMRQHNLIRYSIPFFIQKSERLVCVLMLRTASSKRTAKDCPLVLETVHIW